jgi:ubiquinol-cytochrome c reductase cytochrome b/c1 subunit
MVLPAVLRDPARCAGQARRCCADVWCDCVLFILPWLDTSKVRSGAYRPLFKQFFWIFAANAVVLGYLGAMPAEGIYVIMSQICTTIYFAYFLIALPLLGFLEKPKPLPASISESVLKGGSGTPVGAAAAPETK